MPFENMKDLPAIRWKLQNLARLKAGIGADTMMLRAGVAIEARKMQPVELTKPKSLKKR